VDGKHEEPCSDKTQSPTGNKHRQNFHSTMMDSAEM